MVRIKLSLPPDSTFLSEVIYEGILFSIANSNCTFSLSEVETESDFLTKSYGALDDERIQAVRIVMSGNDNINTKIFEKLGVEFGSRKTYYDLIKAIKEYREHLEPKEKVNIELKTTKKDVLMDVEKKAEGLAAPQLFKVDRYTGISSLETDYTTQQLTFYISKEMALISLLGIYSSFVISTRQQQQNVYYFLFFSPDEILRLMVEGNRELVEKFFTIKEKVMERLRDILSTTTLNELILIDIALNLEIRRLLERENLDKISLTLFKIYPEGQTYKVYEQIPLMIYREQAFYNLAKQYFRNPEALADFLEKAVTSGVIPKALSTLNKKNKFAEADNVLRAIQMLYRFVVLGDANGFFGFLRELSNAHSKLQNSNDRREKSRANEYLKLSAKFRFA